ncbi:hypothetical protein HNR65_002557 [Desulfosalsimonas propionicica]|uniref:Uncharacterized protein n=1 Tax=Desulfosalsimonas propionicica TaxID=332175 RepID=A0A7W0HLP8_9BACT|nr:hypothetical protein [Desulfosalsimonas propionicica]
MLIYSATKRDFRKDVLSNRIEEKILTAYQEKTGNTTSQSEILSWRNSMQYMHNVLDFTKIQNDTGVSIEYWQKTSSKTRRPAWRVSGGLWPRLTGSRGFSRIPGLSVLTV